MANLFDLFHLIISIVLGIGVLVKRDTSRDVKMSSSCRVIDFSSTARCLEFFDKMLRQPYDREDLLGFVTRCKLLSQYSPLSV